MRLPLVFCFVKKSDHCRKVSELAIMLDREAGLIHELACE
jgi:hypothetical protein